MILIAGVVGCGSPSRAPTDASDELTIDAEITSGEFGGACSKHTDCASGYCVDPIGDTGGVCSKECNDDCPTDWECRAVELPQANLKLCVPAAPQLCLACANDGECGGGVCLPIDGGGRCATPCTDQCATGYECVPDASGMHTGSYCQPVTGSCTCSDAMDGAMRSCSNTGIVGSTERTCFGTQLCSAATGWSTCTANTPAAETCDGEDDDCNFVIDDGLSGGGAACQITNGFGSCAGIQSCQGSAGIQCVGKIPTAEACNAIDDDCDAVVDDGYVGLGSGCTAGIGACLRYGSQRCNSAQNGLECSAVAGPMSAETCNQIDDDCNGTPDNGFPTLGQTCAAGLGVCTRYGTNICRTDGAGVQCSATPNTGAMGTEVCNYADDNCDGAVDNGFRNATTGLYTTDQHCGSCGTDCATIYPSANNSFGFCQVGTNAVCALGCNAGSGNLNGSTLDGCEFTLDAMAIYVSVTDTAALDDATCGLGPTGTGAGNHPCKSITQGLARAMATNRARVLVADGTYAEGVTLANGKDVLGGYRADTWERHLATTATVISGSTAAGNHDRTVVAANITATTVFEGFVVRGSFNSKPGGNSYAIYIASSTASLSIRNNQIFAGRGGAGAQGMAGSTGAQGVNGGGQANMNDANYIARTQNGCTGNGTSSAVRVLTNGGARSCGAANVSGGNGGGNWCPPSPNAGLAGNQSSELSGRDGLAGLSGGGGAGGAGADAGDDGYVYQDATRCVVPQSGPSFGLDGSAGQVGTSAGTVAGCSNASGSISSGHWVGSTGATGITGTNGGGGGGGGAGGGGYCADCANGAPTGGNHRIGGHGGGGGSGGCGGSGGTGGGAGGGAFGIFVVGGSAPTITANAITRGGGGSGGNGGIGGAGGLGGQGGAGGQSDLFCTDKAGRGGDGGSAGHGSGGGGGCGGSSFGFYTSGIGSPNYCAGNTVTGGSAGGGGAGGFSGGNSGGAGAVGVLQDCVSL